MTDSNQGAEARQFTSLSVTKWALQFDGTYAGVKAVEKFMGRECGYSASGESHEVFVDILEGGIYAIGGDWIIKGVQGEFYPCKPDIFEKSYRPALAEPAAPSQDAPLDINLICHGECTYNLPERVCAKHGCVIDSEYGNSCDECRLKREVLNKLILAQVSGAAPSSAGTQNETRFAEFDDADHPANKWWQAHGQFMMAGGGRREFIWACRGWIAREQMACGVQVTGESTRERPSSAGTEPPPKPSHILVESGMHSKACPGCLEEMKKIDPAPNAQEELLQQTARNLDLALMEIRMIDEALARRPALSDLGVTQRYEKIMRMCDYAAKGHKEAVQSSEGAASEGTPPAKTPQTVQELHPIAEGIVDEVFNALDRDCAWNIGKEDTIRRVIKRLQKASLPKAIIAAPGASLEETENGD